MFQVDEMESWWNGKLPKWQADKMANWLNQVDKSAGLENNK